MTKYNYNYKHLLILIIISLFYFSLTYLGSYNYITLSDLIIISLLTLTFCVLQFYLIKLITYYFNCGQMLLTLAIFVNIYTLNLCFNEIFIKQSFKTEIFIIIIALFLIYTILSIIRDHQILYRPFVLLLGTLTFVFLASPFIAQSTITMDKNVEMDSYDFPSILFKEKPNVYIIGVDALIPKSLLKRHLDIDTTDLHELLSNNFEKYSNVFSGADRTLPSYLNMFATSNVYWEKLKSSEPGCMFCATPMNRNNLINGLTPSPFVMIFKKNGYQTSFAIEWPLFGDKKGQYIDNYSTRMGRDGKRIKNIFCSLQTHRSYNTGFYGYCYLRDFTYKFFPELHKKELFYKGFKYDFAWILKLFESISSKNQPQLFITHIFSPRHTGFDFKLTDEKQYLDFRSYYIKASNKTSKLLENFLNYIQENDPKSIIMVWGDHGPVLSQQLSWDRRYDLSSTHKFLRNEKFFIQDRLGTYGGIYENHYNCKNIEKEKNRGYTTPSHIIQDIIQCLSSRKSIEANQRYFTTNENQFTFDYPRRDRNQSVKNDIIRYLDYIYE